MARPVPLNCQPHLNGNEPKDFNKAAQDLFHAADELRTVLREQVVGQCMHGRNYQHLPSAQAQQVRQLDLVKAEQVAHWIEQIQQMALSLDSNAGSR